MKLSSKMVYVTAVELGCAVGVHDRDGTQLGLCFPAGVNQAMDLRAQFDGEAFDVTARTPDGEAFLALAAEI